MQVKNLIEQLQSMNSDTEVHFSFNYGDHWNTQVAPTVDQVSMGVVKYSAYHSMDKLMDENEMYEDEGDFEGTRRVVVIG